MCHEIEDDGCDRRNRISEDQSLNNFYVIAPLKQRRAPTRFPHDLTTPLSATA
jgi:hypothetical protein